eukprot:IDg4200t1
MRSLPKEVIYLILKKLEYSTLCSAAIVNRE